MRPTPVSPHAALRAHAGGLYTREAAVELLIAHFSWPHRDALGEFVHTAPSAAGDTPIADIRWPDAIGALDDGRLPCSGREERRLGIAASLADGVPVNLQDAPTGMDVTNIGLVARAILHTGGRK